MGANNSNRITLEKFAKAIYLKNITNKEESKEMAKMVMDFFGFENQVIDNILNQEERDVFYYLQDMNLLKSGSESCTLLTGKFWTTNYWNLNDYEINSIVEKNEFSNLFESASKREKKYIKKIMKIINDGYNNKDALNYFFKDEDTLNNCLGKLENSEILETSKENGYIIYEIKNDAIFFNEDVNKAFQKWNGYLTKEDITELMNDGTNLEDLMKAENQRELVKLIRKTNLGNERRNSWSNKPDESEKEEILNYLIEEIKKRPEINPENFNTLFGVGYRTYVDSWITLKEMAGLEPEIKCPAFNSKIEGRATIIEYAINKLNDKEFASQSNIKKDLKLHIESYGFDDMKQIKYTALEVVVYGNLLENPEISLNKLGKKVIHSNETIKRYLELDKMREYAREKRKQFLEINPEIKINYLEN